MNMRQLSSAFAFMEVKIPATNADRRCLVMRMDHVFMKKIGMALAWISSMLMLMTPSKNRLFVVGAALLAGAAPMVLAEAKPNPYQAIVERNPFGLKPPPPPVDNTPPPVVIPLAKVILTGFSSVAGP